MKETIDRALSDQAFFEYLGESTMIAWIVEKFYDKGVSFKDIKYLMEKLKKKKSLDEEMSISEFVKELADKYKI